MKENKLPYEDCTKEQAVAYLKTHIENQQEVIQKLESENATAHKVSDTKAFCLKMVMETRGHTDAQAKELIEFADELYQYVKVETPKEVLDYSRQAVANVNSQIQGNA
jgi:hypothetical protein